MITKVLGKHVKINILKRVEYGICVSYYSGGFLELMTNNGVKFMLNIRKADHIFIVDDGGIEFNINSQADDTSVDDFLPHLIGREFIVEVSGDKYGIAGKYEATEYGKVMRFRVTTDDSEEFTAIQKVDIGNIVTIYDYDS